MAIPAGLDVDIEHSLLCGLRWEWEVRVPELHTSVCLIPAEQVKNREERLVVLNRIAGSVIDQQRGKHPKFVFTYKGRAMQKMTCGITRSASTRSQT